MGLGEGFELGSPDPEAAAAEEGFLPAGGSHRDFFLEEEGGVSLLLEEGFGGWLPPAIQK